MANMGKYCKAYPVARFRQYGKWTEKAENTRKEKTTNQVDGIESEVPRELTDEKFLYLQETYVVTDGIFLDENIVFNDVTGDWISFCKNQLQFEIPQYDKTQTKAATE